MHARLSAAAADDVFYMGADSSRALIAKKEKPQREKETRAENQRLQNQGHPAENPQKIKARSQFKEQRGEQVRENHKSSRPATNSISSPSKTAHRRKPHSGVSRKRKLQSLETRL